jgi:hypothetical protein
VFLGTGTVDKVDSDFVKFLFIALLPCSILPGTNRAANGLRLNFLLEENPHRCRRAYLWVPTRVARIFNPRHRRGEFTLPQSCSQRQQKMSYGWRSFVLAKAHRDFLCTHCD